MRWTVRLSPLAEADILDIWTYLAERENSAVADDILHRVEEAILSLAELPDRGHLPPELERMNVYTYKEIHCLPYCIVYSMKGKGIFVHCVLDGRRDIQALLTQRLIKP